MHRVIIILFSLTILLGNKPVSPYPKLHSLILPGWGQMDLGDKKRATRFFIQEAGLWLAFIGAKKSSDWYESDYLAFAELHAGVDMQGKNYLYAVNIGHYDDFHTYNQTKEQQRLIKEKYAEGQGLEWQWDSSENRIKFDQMRINAVTHDKYARFAIGGLVLHRLISFVDVLYLERQNNNFQFQSLINPDKSLQVNLIYSF